MRKGVRTPGSGVLYICFELRVRLVAGKRPAPVKSERAFRPYHIGTHVSSQSPRARLSCVVVVVVGQSESSLESVAVRSFML